MKKTAIILINMGGPENQSEISGFIRNLFLDPHIIGAPKPIRRFLAWLISTLRSPKVKKHYELIGGGSPLKKWTSLQAEKVEALLRQKYSRIIVKTAYSYSHPKIDEKICDLSETDNKRIIALPLYPQHSQATLGSIYSDLAKAGKKYLGEKELKTLPPFYEHEAYIEESVRLLKEALEKTDSSLSTHVVFTAHALPQSVIEKGDSYGLHIDRTIYLMLQKLPLNDYTIAFQSKIGPVKWMQPSTVETITNLGKQGIKQVVVVPVGFVCDHIETLYELDIELAEIAQKAGIETFIRAGVFNDSDGFVKFLSDYIEENLR
jgi:protoporphyrin/coproporphyrin ferrochelatase